MSLRNKITRNAFLFGTSLLSSVLLASVASAQTVVGPADAGRVTPPSMPSALTDIPQQLVEVRRAPAAVAPAGAEKVKLTLSEVSYDGLSLYTPEQLAPVFADRVGKTVSLADVYTIAAELTAKFRNDGYILTQVVVPPQTIEGGKVHLQVVEGTIDKITVEGNITDSEKELVSKYAAQVQGGPLNTQKLEQAVLLISDLPGLTARGILSPSATTPGAADLSVVVERKSYEGQVGFDNFSSRYLGPYEGSASVSANSWLGLNERITTDVAYASDQDFDSKLAYGGLTYTQPLGQYGTKVQVAGSVTGTNPGYTLKQYRVNGRSVLLSVKVDQPVVRTRNLNWNVYTLLDWRNANTQSNVDNTRHDRITALRLGTQFNKLDSLFGVGYNTLNVEVARGLQLFGASSEGDADLSRTEGDPSFTKLEAEYQRLQRITSNVNLLIGAKGQAANGAQLSAEEFGVGGISYGRGYDSSEILGDQGVAGKLELQVNDPIAINKVKTYQLYGFLDGGRVWNKDATVSSDQVIDLASTGLGVRVTLPSNTQAGAYVAVPLNRDVGTKGNQDPRFFFNLNQPF